MATVPGRAYPRTNLEDANLMDTITDCMSNHHDYSRDYPTSGNLLLILLMMQRSRWVKNSPLTTMKQLMKERFQADKKHDIWLTFVFWLWGSLPITASTKGKHYATHPAYLYFVPQQACIHCTDAAVYHRTVVTGNPDNYAIALKQEIFKFGDLHYAVCCAKYFFSDMQL